MDVVEDFPFLLWLIFENGSVVRLGVVVVDNHHEFIL